MDCRRSCTMWPGEPWRSIPKSRFESADAMLDALRPPSHPADVPTRVILSPADSCASRNVDARRATGRGTAHRPGSEPPGPPL